MLRSTSASGQDRWPCASLRAGRSAGIRSWRNRDPQPACSREILAKHTAGRHGVSGGAGDRRTMSPHPRRLVFLLSPLLLAAGCSPSGQQQTTQLLNYRLLVQLAPSIALGDVSAAAIARWCPGHAPGRVAVPDRRAGPRQQRQPYPARVVEGLLDPRLMRIAVADTSALPDDQRVDRVQGARRYFVAYGLGSTLRPTAPFQATPPGPAGTVPAGLVLTISVQCPPGRDPFAFANGLADPICD